MSDFSRTIKSIIGDRTYRDIKDSLFGPPVSENPESLNVPSESSTKVKDSGAMDLTMLLIFGIVIYWIYG